MRCLSSRGAGFIGTALINRLVRMGIRCGCWMTLARATRPPAPGRALFTRGDVQKPAEAVDATPTRRLRLPPGSPRFRAPSRALPTRLCGTSTLAARLSLRPKPSAMRVSSASLCASSATRLRAAAYPARQRNLLAPPKAPYAVSKLAAEHYIFALGELYGFETVALRIFNAYGPGQRLPPSHAPVVPLYLKNVLNNASGMVHGDGNQKHTRDCLH